MERDIIRELEGYLRLFNQMQPVGEIVVLLSILNVRNCDLATGPGQVEFDFQERDHLLFPEVVSPSSDNRAVPTTIKGLLDHVWQAFGFGGSRNA